MSSQDYISLGQELLNKKVFVISGASRSGSTGRFNVMIKAMSLLEPIEIEAVKRLIVSKLETNSIDFEFDYSDPIGAVESSDDAEISNRFKEILSRSNPEFYPILINSSVSVERNDGLTRFTVHIPSSLIKAVDFGIIKRFRSKAQELWGWRFDVEIEADDSVKEFINDDPSFSDAVFTSAPVSARQAETPAVPRKAPRRAKTEEKTKEPVDILLGKEILKHDITPMSDFSETTGNACAAGNIIAYEMSEKRDRSKSICRIDFSDKTNTITCKAFIEPDKAASFEQKIKDIMSSGDMILARGTYKFDPYSRDYIFFVNDINRRPAEKRRDNYPGEKRVELHLHTQSSTMDALTKVSEVISTAASWGHKAIAVTDHGVVHSLPEAMKAASENNIKVIFGCEGYLVSDSVIHDINERPFCAVSAVYSKGNTESSVYAVYAAKFDRDGRILDRFHTLVNNGAVLPKWACDDCGIEENDYLCAPDGPEAINSLMSFADGTLLFAFNEDVINAVASLSYAEDEFPIEYVDINKLELNMHLDIKDYSMESGCAPINGRYEELPKRTPENDLEALVGISSLLVSEIAERGIGKLPWFDRTKADLKKLPRYHIIILAASLTGLKNLYKLVSYSHLQYYHKRPCIPRSLLELMREGLILGSACEAGELYRAVSRGKAPEEQVRIAEFYDYLEIQPLDNNMFMTESDEMNVTVEDLRDFNRRVIEIGDQLNKMTVATCDVHFQDPDDAVFRSILLNSQGYADANRMTPLYFRTTDEMLKEFDYLGSERAKEVVITNPNRIAEMCGEQLHPFLDEKKTYSPELPNAKETLESMTMNEAHRRYGDPLPEVVQKRLDKELRSIIGNGYSSLYMVAQKLVSKSLGDGYLVGSRGSVGSSFVATMLGITEVNALPPHYLCPECKYSEFVPDPESRCGIDLPDKTCPVCGTKLKKEGYDIPFEVFLGFKGDKTPDIDLNFSGDYQPVAHRFTEEMFGKGHAFRAGTISAVMDKTVYGYVKHYCEELGLNKTEPEINRLVQGCLGVKKTSGQHPGGIVIVPEDYEIFDFCPVQHPADKNDAGSVTTHFDFHALDDKLVKLDILGHDDPTALRMLHDLTGLDPRTIPLDDHETMSIYSSDKALGVSLEPLGCDVGSLAIPEFGTNFVRGMLIETRPKTMEELVRISGLSHGEDVWNNNAQVLVQNKVATLMEVICTRDDIMNYLISKGCDPSVSFKTMESVRKGRGLKPEMEEMMASNNIAPWFIDSCKKIKYMFPRAHAAAYVMMSFRIAYYKVHYPLEFYAVYFTVRADTFDIELCLGGFKAVMDNLKILKAKDKPDQKEKDAITILEVVAEMNLRGFELLPVDIYKSKAKTFVIEDGKLRPPFTSVAGLGENVAVLIENAAKDGEYSSKEDFAIRTKANSAIMDKLDRLGCFSDLPDSDQIKFSF